MRGARIGCQRREIAHGRQRRHESYQARIAAREFATLGFRAAFCVALQRHGKRAAGELVRVRSSPSPERKSSLFAGLDCELFEEACLTDSGLSADDDQARPSLVTSRELLAQSLEHPLSAEEWPTQGGAVPSRRQPALIKRLAICVRH